MASGALTRQGMFFTPTVALYLLFLLIPLAFFFAIGFYRYSPIEMYTSEFTLENYRRFITDSYYQNIFYTTVKIAFLTSLFSVLIGYPLAYFLARTDSAWRGILMFLIIAPLMSGVIVRTYAWIMLLSGEGIVNNVLMGLGLFSSRPQLLYTELAVIVALVHIMLPYAVFAIYSAIAVQDRDLERAAFSLGASRLRVFFEVTLPLSRMGIVMGSILVFTLAAGAIVTPALLGGTNVSTLGMTIYELVTATLNWPFASAFASVLVGMQFILIIAYTRGSRQDYGAS